MSAPNAVNASPNSGDLHQAVKEPARKTIARSVGALVLTWTLLFLALLVPAAISDERLANGLLEYSGVPSSTNVRTPSGGLVDAYMECIVLLVGSGPDRIAAALTGATPDLITDGPPCEKLSREISDGTLPLLLSQGQSFSHYWHGYTVITRPMISIVGLPILRTGLAAAFIVSCLVLVMSLGRNVGSLAALVFVGVPILLSDAPFLFLSIQHSISYIVAFLASAWVGWRARQAPLNNWHSIIPSVFVAAALTAFVDLASIAPVSALLTCFAAVSGLIMGYLPNSGRQSFRVIGISLALVLAWWFSYFATWILKAASSALLVDNASGVGALLSRLSFRLGSGSGLEPLSGRLSALSESLQSWNEYPYVTPMVVLPLLFGTVALVGFSVWKVGAGAIGKFVALCVPVISVVSYLAIFSGVTMFHLFFMYRGWAYVAGTLVAASVTIFLGVRAHASSTKQPLSDKG